MLWERRVSNRLQITEIEAYARIHHCIHDVEEFTILMLAAEEEVFKTSEEVEEIRTRVKKVVRQAKVR